ncbi:MAG: nucleotide exchange factor GrpE [Gammaproteobacteria bacterium]
MSDQKNHNSRKKIEGQEEQVVDNDEIIDGELIKENIEEDREKEKNKEEDIDVLHIQLAKLQDESTAALDKAVRAQAEMENLRKRTARDVENAHKYALEKFVQELLPVIDSLELGLSTSVDIENAEDLRKGMDLTLEMFKTVIEKFGVVIVNPETEKFDPEFHEAISMQETKNVKSGEIVAVMQKGYSLNGRLIRPAMVIVAK